MKAIVYTSNTGSTARYAELLGHETGLPVYASETRNLPAGAEIIYLGWIMAGEIKPANEMSSSKESLTEENITENR